MLDDSTLHHEVRNMSSMKSGRDTDPDGPTARGALYSSSPFPQWRGLNRGRRVAGILAGVAILHEHDRS